jgi:hypothetical protein
MLEVESTSQIVEQLFKRFMLNQKTFDKKLVGYWVNCIDSGIKTIEDFKTFLIKSHDYKLVIKNKFIDLFYEMLSDTDYYSAFERFMNEKEGSLVEEKDIIEFIKNSKQFIEKYTNIILALFETIIGTPPTNENICFYIKKFQECDGYDIDALRNDLEAKLHDYTLEESSVSSAMVDNSVVIDEFLQKMNDFSDLELKKVYSILNKNGVQEYTQEERIVQGIDMADTTKLKDEILIAAFEEVFARSMDARELLYYKDCFAKTDMSKDNCIELFTKYKVKFDKLYKDISVFLKQYLDEDITEYNFIKRFLNHLDDDDYLDKFHHEIIFSPEYECKMKERLNSLYKHLYDETMENDDEEYVFMRVKDKCYKLYDDTLNNEIVEYKNYIDSISERILHMFMETLDREPDKAENSKFLKIYRRQSDSVPCKAVEEDIVKDLRDSLEYHDIIKRKIRKVYDKIHNDMPHVSFIYSILKKIIDKNDHLTKNIEEIIESYINTE